LWNKLVFRLPVEFMCSLTTYRALTSWNTDTQHYSFVSTTVCASTSGLLCYYYYCYESSPLEGYFTADCEAYTHLIDTYLRTGNWKVIEIYLLTAIGLTPGGSSTVHIYTKIIHRKTQLIWEQCGPCPVFASYTLAFALQLRKNTEKPQSG
jgi:hypothetical protein